MTDQPARDALLRLGMTSPNDHEFSAAVDRYAAEVRAAAQQPRRDDAVEAWLKAQRDQYDRFDGERWWVLDELLNRYRRHADTGTPLHEHVCAPWRADCDCRAAAGRRAAEGGGA